MCAGRHHAGWALSLPGPCGGTSQDPPLLLPSLVLPRTRPLVSAARCSAGSCRPVFFASCGSWFLYWAGRLVALTWCAFEGFPHLVFTCGALRNPLLGLRARWPDAPFSFLLSFCSYGSQPAASAVRFCCHCFVFVFCVLVSASHCCFWGRLAMLRGAWVQVEGQGAGSGPEPALLRCPHSGGPYPLCTPYLHPSAFGLCLPPRQLPPTQPAPSTQW